MDKLEKVKEIEKIQLEILDVIKSITELAQKPASKYPKVNTKRMFKILALAFRVRSLGMQIRIIQSQPEIPYDCGGVTHLNKC